LSDNPLEAFGAWISGTADDWPEDARRSAHREFIDTIAVMVPGAIEPAVRKIAPLARHWGQGPCHTIGETVALAAPWAALVNGCAGHALDFDDNFDPPKAHASTVLVPAIFAVADEHGASGGQCIDAYIVGLQIQGRIGQGVNPAHRNRGWHATATMGAMGAAAAAARLMKLDSERSAMALSIATSMAAGFMAQFGTMTKPLHAGLAAKAGVMAASFAAAGLTAGWHTLDGPNGMNVLMVGPDLEDLRAANRQPEHGQTLYYECAHVGAPLLITEHAFRVKRFPNCGASHRSIDAVLDLREAHGITADAVEKVNVRAPLTHLNNLMYRQPETGLEGKFSIEYALACALVTGDCTLADFTDDAVMRPEIRALFPRIHRDPVDLPESQLPTTVTITLKGGRVVEQTVTMPKGSKPAPFPTEQYWRKFDSCLGTLMRPTDKEALRQTLEALPALDDAGALTRCLAVPLGGNGAAS